MTVDGDHATDGLGKSGSTDGARFAALEARLRAIPGGEELAGDLHALVDEREVIARTLKRQSIAYSTVLEIANRINASGLDLRRIENYTASMIRGQFGVLRIFLLRGEPTEEGTVAVTIPAKTALGGLAFAVEGPFGSYLTEQARPITVEAFAPLAARFPEFGAMQAGGVAVCVPLVHTGTDDRRELVGVLGVGEKLRHAAFGTADLELLEVLANMIGIAIHNAQLYHRSIVDGLTRVYSRGHFDVHLVHELSRVRRRRLRAESPAAKPEAGAVNLSLVMLDIDHFKRLNDAHGHQTGDLALRAVAHALHDAVRAMDIVSRYGGEEFAVVLPETAKADAMRVAERLRARVAALGLKAPGGEALDVSASFGVATFPDDAEEVRELVAAADKALYAAKAAGRNRVLAANGPAAPPADGDAAPHRRRKDE